MPHGCDVIVSHLFCTVLTLVSWRAADVRCWRLKLHSYALHGKVAATVLWMPLHQTMWHLISMPGCSRWLSLYAQPSRASVCRASATACKEPHTQTTPAPSCADAVSSRLAASTAVATEACARAGMHKKD